jgi:hypothetical protein
MFAGRHSDRSHGRGGGTQRCAGCIVLWSVSWCPPDGNEPCVIERRQGTGTTSLKSIHVYDNLNCYNCLFSILFFVVKNKKI